MAKKPKKLSDDDRKVLEALVQKYGTEVVRHELEEIARKLLYSNEL